MKKRLLSMILAISMMLALLPAGATTTFAASDSVSKFTYEFNDSTKEATVTGPSSSFRSSDNIDIPATVSHNQLDYSVTAIADKAFYNKRNLTGTLTIPDGVVSIGQEAFSGCSGLKGSLTIPDSVTSIGKRAFSGCSGFNGALRLSEHLTTIEEGIFYVCSGLTGSLVIPEGVTAIKDEAFAYCSSLTGDLKIPNNVASIGANAFSNCSNLNGTLTIPDGINHIGAYAFAYCSNLKGTPKLVKNATKIEDGIYIGCKSLAGTLTIPESVTSIGEYTFKDCSSLTGELIIPSGVTSIGNNVFEGCANLTGNLVIPDKVTYIGIWAFSGCEKLGGNLVIPNSVSEINHYAFQHTNLSSITLPYPITLGMDLFGTNENASVNLKKVYYNGFKEEFQSASEQQYWVGNTTKDVYYRCRVALDTAGGSTSTVLPDKIYQHDILSLETPTKQGCTFTGWSAMPADAYNAETGEVLEDVTLTAKWTQKDAIDPDADLKFDPATGEVTSNNPNIQDSDIVNRKVYDENGNEIPSDKLNDKGLPTEPGNYIIKVDVKETDKTAPADQITGNQSQWKYNVPKKEEPSDNTDKDDADRDDTTKETPKRKLDISDGILTSVTVKDENGNVKDITDTITKDADGKYEIPVGVTVTITAKDAPEGMKFGEWTISDKSLLGNPDVPYTEKDLTFTMPDNADGVSVSVVYLEESIGEEPNLLEKGAVAGTVIVGSAALLYQGHMLGTELYLRYLLPHGAIVPQNRAELAVLLWQDAGNPEPVSTVLYSDISDEDSAIQQAARWAVENDLLELLDEDDCPDHFAPFAPVSFTDSIHAWKKAQELKQ